jgi:60 kDa SS-A/Ro ribonucleoprotein
VKESPDVTTNYMGGKAFKQSPKEELVFAVITSFMESTYYESAEGRHDRITALVETVALTDPTFVAKLAVYNRKRFHMRSSTHAMLAAFARTHRGDSLVRQAIVGATERPDDLTEILALLPKPIPNGVKRGVAAALVGFDEYSLGKYRGEGHKMSLIDAVNLTHPAGNGNVGLAKLVKDELRSTDTWETKVSAAGGDEEATTEAWRELLEEGKLGYMAALRNLVNIAKTGEISLANKVAELISDKERVRTSKQLPFRFLSAWGALEALEEGKTRHGKAMPFESDNKAKAVVVEPLKQAVKAALGHSADNIPVLEGQTLILTDNSGSMRGDAGGNSLLSAYSNPKTSDIANLFAALYWAKAKDTAVGTFGDKLLMPELTRDMDVFAAFKAIDKTAAEVGPGTEEGVFVAFEKLLADKRKVARILIFSDQQVGEGCSWYDTGRRGTGGLRGGSDFNKLLQEYRTFSPETVIYSVDLQGYGNKLFGDGVFLLAGFSDRIFELMELLEQDKKALVRDIEAIELPKVA